METTVLSRGVVMQMTTIVMDMLTSIGSIADGYKKHL
jgi:hypothetical protein